MRLVEVLLYVHRNRRFIRDGEPRKSTSTFTQTLHTRNEGGQIHYNYIVIRPDIVNITMVGRTR